jgi:hypothetical protein
MGKIWASSIYLLCFCVTVMNFSTLLRYLLVAIGSPGTSSGFTFDDQKA